MAQAVDPRDGVRPALLPGFGIDRQKFRQAAKGLHVHLKPGALNAFELQLRLRDHARQPQAAYRGGKPVRLSALGCGVNHLPVGARQAQAAHVLAEAARAVVAFAVHVIGDGPAHRHHLRAGRNRQHPAAPDGQALHVAQQRAGFAGEHAFVFVKADEAVQPARGPQRAAGVQRHIAIAAPRAICNARPARLQLRQQRRAIGLRERLPVVRIARQAAPAFNGHFRHSVSFSF